MIKVLRTQVSLPLLCALMLLIAAHAAGQSSNLDLVKLSATSQALVERTSPAVVGIIATGYSPGDGGFWSEEGLLTRQQSGGSGVILSPDGYVLTNAHVIEGSQRIQVVLSAAASATGQVRSVIKPRGRIAGAQIVGVDLETDLAVLKIDESGLPFLRLGNSEDVSQGQLVFAFGSPMGLENSVTMGVVSAVARQLRPESPMIYIQTDASINPGNSGGPLINAMGEVIGINTSILSQSGGAEGIGFAAPSNIVRTIYTQIKERGYVRRGEIGVNAQTITPALAAGLGLKRQSGVIIADVLPASPAQTAGLQIGDVVLSLDDKPMENGRQFQVNLYGKAEGATVRLVALRGADTIRITSGVTERQAYQDMLTTLVTPERNLISRLGILAVDLTPQLQEMLGGTRYPEGIVVAARSRSGLMWEQSLQPGDIIYSINGKQTATLEQTRSLVTDAGMGTVVLHVERHGELLFITVDTN
jgi:serine protease Do